MATLIYFQWKPFLRGHPDKRPPPWEKPLDNVNLNINVLISRLETTLLETPLFGEKGEFHYIYTNYTCTYIHVHVYLYIYNKHELLLELQLYTCMYDKLPFTASGINSHTHMA